MKLWHRWSLFAAAVPFLVVGFLAMHEAWWATNPTAAVCLFGAGFLIFGAGIALIAGARGD